MDLRRWRAEERQKLAQFLQQKAGGTGKGIRRQLEKNVCRVNGAFERFGSRWIERGDVVEYQPKEEQTAKFTTLFENEHLLVVDKPAGWVCSAENCRRTFGPLIELVHRLDKDTTGALLLSKDSRTRDALMELFEKRLVEKEYLALVDGIPKQDRGSLRTHLAKKGSFHGQTIWGSATYGDLAITHWEVLKRGKQETLLLVRPETGRTHQIRVHLSEIGHPILVDRQYAKRFRSPLFAARPLLHASRLRFPYLGESIDVSSPFPSDFVLCTRQNQR